jgi:hypothetical protein
MVIAVMVGTFFGFGGQSLADMSNQGGETIANIQRVNRLMGRAMGMVTEGASLVLVANMKIAPPTDSITAGQGMKMIENGKDLVQMALAGEGMSAMKKKEMDDDPMMKVTKSLGESILKYVSIVENMGMSGTIESKIKLHQTHRMINHALDMAAEGANLVMLGNLKLAEVLDKYTVEQGRMMLRDARMTLAGVSDSETMKDMKQADKGSMDDTMMTRTNELSETALKIIDALERMSM